MPSQLVTFTAGPETQLLLLCSRRHLAPEERQHALALIERGVDWPSLVEFASQERVFPLLHWHLDREFRDHVPREVLEGTRRQFVANGRRNLALSQETLRLLDALGAAGIEAVPYKGTILAERLYGNLALRQVGDIDLLVRRDSALEARRLLRQLGYEQVKQLQTKDEQEYIDDEYAYQLMRDDGPYLVELHWALAPRKFLFPLDVDDLWRRAGRVSFAGRSIRTLSGEDLLLVLCVHLAAHCWRGTQRLKWICDISELVRRQQELDWGQTIKEAERLGSLRMVYLGLDLARRLFDAPLPPEVLRRLQADGEVATLTATVCKRIFADREIVVDGRDRRRFFIRMRERWRDRWTYRYERQRSRLMGRLRSTA